MNIRVTDDTANSKQVDLVVKASKDRRQGLVTEVYISEQMQEFMVSSKLISDDRDSGA